mmetsp:Transcript_26152/g.65745  ORF Transcript_26152/g.65745 Transcript_26152/m.65745 type:complete len:331 (+) Transcript_26152:1723-2715(+)
MMLGNRTHTHGVQRLNKIPPIEAVVHTRYVNLSGLIEKLVVFGAAQLVEVANIIGSTGSQMVEDVIVALTRAVYAHAALLQQIGRDLGAHNLACRVEADLSQFAETRRVVVAHRLGVAERLQDRRSFHQLLLHGGELRVLAGQELDDELGGLGLSAATLAADHDRLRFASVLRLAHAFVGVVGHRKDVRRKGTHAHAHVHVHLRRIVERKHPIGVHRHQHVAGVGVDLAGRESLGHVLGDGGQRVLLHGHHVLLAHLHRKRLLLLLVEHVVAEITRRHRTALLVDRLLCGEHAERCGTARLLHEMFVHQQGGKGRLSHHRRRRSGRCRHL